MPAWDGIVGSMEIGPNGGHHPPPGTSMNVSALKCEGNLRGRRRVSMCSRIVACTLSSGIAGALWLVIILFWPPRFLLP